MAELQGDYVTCVIERLINHDISTIEPNGAAGKEWVEHIVDLVAPTLIMGAKSCYTGREEHRLETFCRWSAELPKRLGYRARKWMEGFILEDIRVASRRGH
ncbi:hypothetical protein ACMFMG_005581 [Clarireedia jacksonii]